MMNCRQNQSGLTLISWIGVLAILGLFGLIVIRLFPVYMEHFAVASAVQGVADEKVPRTPDEIRDTLIKRFDVNDVTHATGKNIHIEQGTGGYNVSVNYQVQVPFVYNIEFLVTFSDSSEVKAP